MHPNQLEVIAKYMELKFASEKKNGIRYHSCSWAVKIMLVGNGETTTKQTKKGCGL